MINKLEMLLALAKERHFGRAALSMGITQPTLSAGIRQLEDQLGVRLVQRGSRFGGLTPEGQRTLEWAQRIVGDTRRLREEMRSRHAGLSGHLRLAVIPTALTRAARLVSRFTAKHPNVGFTILSRSSTELQDMLETLDADAGLTYLDNEPLGRVIQRPIYRERYVVLCPKGSRLAALPTVSWHDLAEEPLCLLTPDMQNRRILNRNFLEAGVTPNAMVESNSTIVLATQVMEGHYATVLPEQLARFLAEGHDLVVRDLEGGLRPQVGLIALHQEPFTPVLEALLRMAAPEEEQGG